MKVHLETERLILREFTPEDLENLVELDSDPAVMFYITGGVTPDRAEVTDEILPAFLGYHQRGTRYGFWAVQEKATGQFTGWVHFRPEPGHPDDEPELGYRLRQQFWGRGFAAEGSRALIDKGFREDRVSRVVATTMAVNTGSRRVMEKCGLLLVRTFHQDWPYPIPGDEHGDVEYAITREQWSAAGGGA